MQPEQGQPPPGAEGTTEQQPPPDQGTTSAPESRQPQTPDTTQPSPGSDDRQQAEGQGEQVSPTPTISWGKLSPEDRRRLLDEADPEELRKHERVAGLSGQMAERLYRRRLSDLTYDDLPSTLRDDLARRVRDDANQQANVEQERQLGQQGEFYSLGQKRWENLQQNQTEEQRRRAEQQTEQKVLKGFQESVTSWATENFASDVIDKTAADLRESGEMDKLDFKSQYNLWLKTLVSNATAHTSQATVQQERKRWEEKDLPAYRERWLAERNGGEPSPETDGGPPAGVRELTDEIIAGMDLEAFKAVWDMKTDKPKQGYRYRSTRGINPREVQRAGRGS